MDRQLRPTIITDLNYDCLREVFQHLDLDALITVADVCYRFRQTAQSHFEAKGDKSLDLRKAVRARNFVSTEPALLRTSKILRNFGGYFNSIQVSIGSIPKFANLILALIARYCSNGNLIEVSLIRMDLPADVQGDLQVLLPHLQKFNWFGSPSKGLLEVLSQQWPKLESLSFEDTDIKNETMEKILEKNPQLKILLLKDCLDLDYRIIRPIAEHLPLLEHFKFIKHHSFPFIQENLYLSELNKLNRLEISSSGGAFCCAADAMAAAKVPLEHLWLCVTSSVAPTRFVESISKLTTLKSLTIYFNNQRSSLSWDASHIIKIIESLNELNEFSWKAYPLELHTEELLELIRKGEKLRTINVSSCFGTIDAGDFLKMVEIVQNRRERIHLKVGLTYSCVEVPEDLVNKYSDYVLLVRNSF